MSRAIDLALETPLSVEQIHAAYSDEEYWFAWADTYGENSRLDAVELDDHGDVRVVLVQDLRSALLPKPLARVYSRDLQIVQDARWRLAGDAELRGETRLEARGAAGSGLSRVTMTSDGVRLRCTGTVKVAVPVIGGTIESALVRQTAQSTPEMLRFTAQWLDERS